LNLAALDDDGLIVARRGAGPVNDAHVRERDQRRFNAYELLAIGLLGQHGDSPQEKTNGEQFDFHAGNCTSKSLLCALLSRHLF
jgi:hypothetical protein